MLLFTDRVNPLVPDSVRDPAHILDCGYGTGEWASAVAESFPDSQVRPSLSDRGVNSLTNNNQVTGIDISPVLVQRNDRPDNFIPEVRQHSIVNMDGRMAGGMGPGLRLRLRLGWSRG